VTKKATTKAAATKRKPKQEMVPLDLAVLAVSERLNPESFPADLYDALLHDRDCADMYDDMVGLLRQTDGSYHQDRRILIGLLIFVEGYEAMRRVVQKTGRLSEPNPTAHNRRRRAA
jgi:hypothetical protein